MLYLLKSIKIILYIRIGKINEKNMKKQRKKHVKNINDNKTDDFIQANTLIFALINIFIYFCFQKII